MRNFLHTVKEENYAQRRKFRIFGGHMDISNRIKELPSILGKTQKALSDMVGCSTRTWQSYGSGKTSPDANVLARICQEGINANWLLTGEGPMHRDDLAAVVAVEGERDTTPALFPSPPDEARLLENYRKLSNDYKDIVRGKCAELVDKMGDREGLSVGVVVERGEGAAKVRKFR